MSRLALPDLHPFLHLGLAATVLVACGQGTAKLPSPTAPNGATSPAAQPAPTTAAATPARPSSSAQLGPVAIADGTYRTDALDVDDFRKAIRDDAKLTAGDKTTITDTLFELADHRSMVVEVSLKDGKWVQAGSFDGGAFEVGSRATIAFPDSSTLVISEQCCGLTTFTVTPVVDGFTLHRVSGTQNTEVDVLTGRLLFENVFHRVP